MPQLDEKTIAYRSAEAWRLRDLWRWTLRDAYELAQAARNPYDVTQNPRSLSRQYDSTASLSVIKGANRLQTELTPPGQRWSDIVAGPLLEMQLGAKDLAQLKQELVPINLMIGLAFQSGMFINSIWEAYIDLLIAGMGAMLTLEDKDPYGVPVIFQSVSQSEIAIDENGKGLVGGIFRKRKKFKVRNIADIWPDAKKPPALVKLLADSAKSTTPSDPEIELLEATYEGGPGSNVAWYYEVLWMNGGNPVRIVERQYDTCPWIIFRWSKLPGIPYGPGPVLMALADIRTANAMVEMLLKNAALALGGIYLGKDDGVLNPDNVILTPGAIIPVGSTDSLKPLETGRDFSIAQLVLEKLQDSIKKALFDTALPGADSTVRSPTEIIQRVQEATQDIGGNIGRIANDLVHVVRRVVDIYYKQGLIPSKLHIDQFTLKVQINSPLARAQQMSEVQTVMQWIQMVQGIGGPQAVMMAAKLEVLNVWLAERMGVPADLYNSVDEQETMQKQLATIAAAQQQNGIPPPSATGAPPPMAAAA